MMSNQYPYVEAVVRLSSPGPEASVCEEATEVAFPQ